MFVSSAPVVEPGLPQAPITETTVVEVQPVETLDARIARVRSIPPEQLSAVDLEWWKSIQLQFGTNGLKPQIQLEDSHEVAMQKLADAGIRG